MEYIRVIMYRSGIPAESVLGHTPGASIGFSDLLAENANESIYENRAEEIQDWIRNGHSHVTRYAIVEPWPITPGYDKLGLHHVQTRLGEGLSESDAARFGSGGAKIAHHKSRRKTSCNHCEALR